MDPHQKDNPGRFGRIQHDREPIARCRRAAMQGAVPVFAKTPFPRALAVPDSAANSRPARISATRGSDGALRKFAIRSRERQRRNLPGCSEADARLRRIRRWRRYSEFGGDHRQRLRVHIRAPDSRSRRYRNWRAQRETSPSVPSSEPASAGRPAANKLREVSAIGERGKRLYQGADWNRRVRINPLPHDDVMRAQIDGDVIDLRASDRGGEEGLQSQYDGHHGAIL